MTYSVKEIFYTLQGEGANAGRAAVFCRFSGCNLWNGREDDRHEAICNFCDTEFVGTDGKGGGKFNKAELVEAIEKAWLGRTENLVKRLVVCTGGEPLLQLDEVLVRHLHEVGFEVAVETNGTKLPPTGVDWICVSPKQGAELKLVYGNELKLVYPQIGMDPEDFTGLEFDHYFLQPMDGPDQQYNTQLAVEYCLANPQWQLSLQTHKIVGIP